MQSVKNIWLLTVGEPLPSDPGSPRLHRSGMLYNELVRRGHEVTWWTSTFDHFSKTQRFAEDTTISHEGGQIIALHGCGYPRNLSLRRFRENALVARRFAHRAVRAELPDLILCSYPIIELCHEGVRFGRSRGVPTVVDVRDLWPDVIVNAVPGPLRPVARIGLGWLQRQAEYVLRGCDGIAGISPQYLDFGLGLAGRGRRESDAIFSLGYGIEAPAPEALERARERLEALGVNPERRIVWYVGTFGSTYDLLPVIEGARRCGELEQDVQFVISGAGDDDAMLRARAAGLANVCFTGWVGAAEVFWLRQVAAVGLQPYRAGAPQGLANKLFEYISAGIPVVSSLAGENERFVAQHGCGVTYRAGDAGDFVAKLRAVLQNDANRRTMGAAGLRAFEAEHSSSMVYGRMADYLEARAESGS